MMDRDAPTRGQLAVLTAVVLATLFVALALVVNGAISTENRSTRGPADADDGLVETSTALETVDELLDRSNADHNASHATATRNVTAMVAAWQRAQRSRNAERGAHSHVAIADLTNGTHVRQANDSRSFADAAGTDADWTVVEDARGVSDYRLTVQRDHLYTDPGDSLEATLEDAFAVHVSNASGTTWTLHVYEDTDGEVAVRSVRDGEVGAACTADAGTVGIDLVEGTVGGEPCSTLSFADGLTGAVDVEYRNPGRSAGTYEFRVDRILTPETDGRYRTPGDGSPSAAPNLYSATAHVTYDDGDVSVTRAHRVVAGDPVYETG